MFPAALPPIGAQPPLPWRNMSKKIEVDIIGFEGSVLIADPLNLSQAQAIELAMIPDSIPDELIEAKNKYLYNFENLGKDHLDTLQSKKEYEAISEKNRIWFSVKDEKRLPAVIACVEKWEIPTIPEDRRTESTFPSSPRGPSHKLIEFLFNEIFKIYVGELKIPNE